jgi:membrane-associated HD superfamily phosphohydrolase
MITVGAAFPYLVQSVLILALCCLWVAALLDIQTHMRTRVTSHKVLVFIAIAISVLAVFLIVATDALFTFDNRGEPFSPWSDWGVRLGS